MCSLTFFILLSCRVTLSAFVLGEEDSQLLTESLWEYQTSTLEALRNGQLLSPRGERMPPVVFWHWNPGFCDWQRHVRQYLSVIAQARGALIFFNHNTLSHFQGFSAFDWNLHSELFVNETFMCCAKGGGSSDYNQKSLVTRALIYDRQ